MKKILSALLLSTVLVMPAMAAGEKGDKGDKGDKEQKHEAAAEDASPKAGGGGKMGGKGMGGKKHMGDGDESKIGCGAEHRRVTLRVSWSIRNTKSMGDAKGKLDALLKDIADDAAAAGVKDLVAQGVNYTLNLASIKEDDGSRPAGYMLNGRAEYNMDSEAAGIKLAEMLHKKNLQAEMLVRSAHLGRCVNSASQ